MDDSGRIFASNNIFLNGQFKTCIGEIFQVSELSLIRSGIIAEHMQLCDEITYIISGKAKIYVGDKCEVVHPGHIHFVKSNVTHRIEAEANENLRFICIAFHPDFSNPIVKKFIDIIHNTTLNVVKDNGAVKALSDLLIREFYNSDEESKIMIDGYLTQILITLTRILLGKTYMKSNIEEKSSQYIMYKLLRYIDREYLQIKNVKSVAEAMCYSEYYLSHLFSKKMNITIKEYITRKKITYAAELLETTNLSIERLAEQLNFASSHSFRRAFKQYMGVTPSEYKKKISENTVEQGEKL